MKPSKARRMSEQCGVEELVRNHPDIDNPFEKTDRRYRMFESVKREYWYCENLINDMGGTPKEKEE